VLADEVPVLSAGVVDAAADVSELAEGVLDAAGA
jgi:hypothetical protein